ncbi:MAG: 2-C-methyl-D-erythritol 4-phosphate cytidylyltransferase [Candidatus Dormiibacterota bacterium]
MEVGIVIAAAGAGTRLARGSKALVEIGGATLVAHAVRRFSAMSEIGPIVVVAPAADEARVGAAVQTAAGGRAVVVCAGGSTRQESVRAGLAALAPCEIVLVHDAARPLASESLVRRVIAAALEVGAVLPGVTPRDAVRRVSEGRSGRRLDQSLDRGELVLAQTPQGFRRELLERAHEAAREQGLAADDDAQLVAAIGHPVAIVEGESTNVKVTVPEDLPLVEHLLRALLDPADASPRMVLNQ